MVCKQCLDILKIEEPDANDVREQLEDPHVASNEEGANEQPHDFYRRIRRMFTHKQLASRYCEKKVGFKKIVKSHKRKQKRGAQDYNPPVKHRANKKMKEASREEKFHRREYDRLKREVGYTSSDASSCSSSDDDAFSTLSDE